MRHSLVLTGTLALALCLSPLGMSLKAANLTNKTLKRHKPKPQNAGQKSLAASDQLQAGHTLKPKTKKPGSTNSLSTGAQNQAKENQERTELQQIQQNGPNQPKGSPQRKSDSTDGYLRP